MKIAVCCSSSDDINKKYIESSRNLLEKIFKYSHELIFGATYSGIMKEAYLAAKNKNRKVTGIVPNFYKDNLELLDCDTKILTKSVANRTEALFNNADILLFLPGGVGTIYELFSAIEMKRSNELDKPIIVYNETHFFDNVLKMLDNVYEENFTNKSIRASYDVINNSMNFLDVISNIEG